jgi:hypothetical protein
MNCSIKKNKKTKDTSISSFVEYYVTIRLSESQYKVLEKVSKVKAMSILQYCHWALRQVLENDIELHFANETKDRMLEELQQDKEE